MREFILKQIKSIGYASAAGTLVIGGASVDMMDADAFTIAYMVIAAIGFNVLKELLKNGKNGKHTAP